MRGLLVLAAAVVVTGCGERTKAVEGHPRDDVAKVEKTGAERPVRKCTSVSRGYRACSIFFVRDGHTAIYRRHGDRWRTVLGALPHRAGWWRPVLASGDRETLLAQWSGECEVQSTYLVSVADRRARPLFLQHASGALGWSPDGKARVVLAEPVYGTPTTVKFRPGTYRIDPATMAAELEQPLARKSRC